MNKKIFIVSSTLRRGGNSELLAYEFGKGAKESGNDVEMITLRDFELKFCIGCLSCQKTGRCVLFDKMNSFYETVRNSDILVFATPVYYYEISGQLKTFLDRLNPLYSKQNRFRSVYLLASAAEDDESAFDGAVNAIGRWLDCFEGLELKGVVKAGGVNSPGEVRAKAAFKRAYEMGKSL